MCIVVAFFLAFTSLYSPNFANGYDLQLVQILFRHGDRAPISLYPTDPNKDHFWPEGLGMLTRLGRKQHYELGKVFRKMYSGFISTSPMEVNILSSETDRCVKSAETNAASFYAPESEWKFETNVNWQPLTVHSIPKSEDKYLETDTYCPRAEEELERVINSPEGQKFIKENEAMFKKLTEYSGKNITSWKSASYLHDTLFIEEKYNLTIPSWASLYWNQLQNVSDLSFYWTFNSPLLLRLRAGPLLGKIIEKMQMKILDELSDAKIQIYSAHDTNVAALLHALNVFNMKQPPYCASVIFELHKANNDFAVRMLYLNSSFPEQGWQDPHVLIIDGCSEYCPFDYFVNYTKNMVPKDWESECSLKHSVEEFVERNIVITCFVTGFVASIIVIGMCGFLWKLRQRSRRKCEYSYHHLMPDVTSPLN